LILLLLPSVVLAQSKSVLIEDLTWTEVRDAIAAGKTTAIYYAASTEQNGPGLALGKHIFIAHYAAQRIAEELGNALVYPTALCSGRRLDKEDWTYEISRHR
jgi:creatinine amidohydrolase